MSFTLNAADYPIKAVTVFNCKKAEVVRTFSLDLNVGQNQVAINSLPSVIDTETVRMTVYGEGKDAVLFDVSCEILDSPPPGATAQLIKNLEREREVLQGEKTLISNAASNVLIKFGYSLNAENNTVTNVENFLDSLLERGPQMLERARDIDDHIDELDKKIAQQRKTLKKEKARASTDACVTAVIMAKQAGRVAITLTYMVSNATWSSTYDLHAASEGGRPPRTVSLHYRAVIQQDTGEDWRDTAIAVSTATPGNRASIPRVRKLQVMPAKRHTGGLFAQSAFSMPQQNQQFQSGGLFGPSAQAPQQPSNFRYEPQPAQAPIAPVVFGAAQKAVFVSEEQDRPWERDRERDRVDVRDRERPTNVGEESWTPVDGADNESTASQPVGVEEPENEKEESSWAENKTVVTESVVASSFRIEGACTIPSEKKTHKVAIAILSFDAKVHYVAVPRSTPSAFLQCEVTNKSEYRLLRGPVNVYLDNSPVSKTSITDVNPEETFKCTLGLDPLLCIRCIRLPRTSTTTGSAFSAKTTTATYKLSTIIQNKHSFAVANVIVRDSLPIAPSEGYEATHDGSIQVVLKRPEALQNATDGSSTGGIVKGKSKSSETQISVRWSEDNGDKEGRFEWVADIGAGDEVKLESEYEVRAPSNFQWHLREDYF